MRRRKLGFNSPCIITPRYRALIVVYCGFSGVRCQDTVDGFRCGPCPEGYIGDGQRCRPRGCEMSPCSPGISTYYTNTLCIYI